MQTQRADDMLVPGDLLPCAQRTAQAGGVGAAA
jgi:hypothetical protein